MLREGQPIPGPTWSVNEIAERINPDFTGAERRRVIGQAQEKEAAKQRAAELAGFKAAEKARNEAVKH